jgi:hypothetical protein
VGTVETPPDKLVPTDTIVDVGGLPLLVAPEGDPDMAELETG